MLVRIRPLISVWRGGIDRTDMAYFAAR